MEEKELLEFNALIIKAEDFLLNRLNIPVGVVNIYRRQWKEIRTYLVDNRIKTYNQDVEEKLLSMKYPDRDMAYLKADERYFHRCILFLREIKESGEITSFPAKPKRKDFELLGSIGKIMRDFLTYKEDEEGCVANTLRYNRRHLSLLSLYLEKNNITAIHDIDSKVLLSYISSISNTRCLPQLITVLRSFFRYLYSHKYTKINLVDTIPLYRSVKQPKLPSSYSVEEIEKLIASVDRSQKNGKRSYAVILLAARLGLRASDIALLKFENIDWETNTITITQFKTGKVVQLPLLTEVGNAIINYLKYARPISEEPFVFLNYRSPFKPLYSSAQVTQIVQRAFRASGVHIKNKKFGSHSLRHSLASRLIEKFTSLPVISEVLGHTSSDSTKYYLRIDLMSLKRCMLEVPPVDKKFYKQKGGYFYE